MKNFFFSEMKSNKILVIILLLTVIISLVYFYVKKRKEIESLDKSVEMVISRYNEDLEWLKTEPFNKFPCSITIYNKGVNDNFYKPEKTKEVVKLPNVGRCDHTYLYHIIKNYDNLSDIVVFLPGSAEMHDKNARATKLLNTIEKENSAVLTDVDVRDDVIAEIGYVMLDNYTCMHGKNKELNPESAITPAPLRPFSEWYKSRLGNRKIQAVTHYGIFSVAKEDILQHPKSYYENLIKDLEVSSNPEVGHYFERAWVAVFYPMNNTKTIKNEGQ